MEFLDLRPVKLKVVCPKHGTHEHYIASSVKNYKGHWCMLCWLESLGDPLPTIEEKYTPLAEFEE